MTPKEKAEQLFQLYLPFVESGHIEDIKYRCKQCALIAVDEVMQKTLWDKSEQRIWKEVKQEIEAL
jgi:hypothetical protein